MKYSMPELQRALDDFLKTQDGNDDAIKKL